MWEKARFLLKASFCIVALQWACIRVYLHDSGNFDVEMVLLIGGWVWIVFAHRLKSIKDLALRVMATLCLHSLILINMAIMANSHYLGNHNYLSQALKLSCLDVCLISVFVLAQLQHLCSTVMIWENRHEHQYQDFILVNSNEWAGTIRASGQQKRRS